jgi:hypothetical protein
MVCLDMVIPAPMERYEPWSRLELRGPKSGTTRVHAIGWFPMPTRRNGSGLPPGNKKKAARTTSDGPLLHEPDVDFTLDVLPLLGLSQRPNQLFEKLGMLGRILEPGEKIERLPQLSTVVEPPSNGR